MSLSSALSNALSGLNTSALEAELIANNVANAQTAGYTRKVAELSAVSVDGSGAGVTVSGIRLMEDPAAVASRRQSDAEFALHSTTAAGLGDLTALLGTPGNFSALGETAARFEASLLAAANDPASAPRLANAVGAAGQYVEALTSLSTETQALRASADAEIATQVEQVNTNLQSIEALNREIRMLTQSGGDASALLDERKSLIDQVASILPIRTSSRPGGEVAIYTNGGAKLLDGPASELALTGTPIITQDMTLASGALSGLSIDGRPVNIGLPDGSGPADGGSLSALFVQRDTILPEFAIQLDALAEDLVTRFDAAGIDASRTPGDPGLFTDNGGAYAGANLEGLAGRLSLNATVDPLQGGAAWRLRDGLGAATPGEAGNAELLIALSDAATTARAPVSSLGFTQSGGLADFAAGLTSVVFGKAAQAETRQSYSAAVNGSLRQAELSVSGVNTDVELQSLLRIEKAYAANALVLSTVDDLVQRLLEI